MEIGDAFIRVHHRRFGPFCVSRLDVGFDFGFLVVRQFLDFQVKIAKTQIGRDAERRKGCGMLFENVFKVDINRMSEENGIGDLHHGGFKVQRQQQVPGLGILHLCFIVLAQDTAMHHGRIEDFSGFKG